MPDSNQHINRKFEALTGREKDARETRAHLKMMLSLFAVIVMAAVFVWNTSPGVRLTLSGPTVTATLPTQTSQPTLTLTPTITPTPTAGPAIIYWSIGFLGTGSQPEQIPLERAFVEKYNSTQGQEDGVILVSIIDYQGVGHERLRDNIAAGNSPDIVGPTGIHYRGWVEESVLDLWPFIDNVAYDWDDFVFFKFYSTKNGLMSLPFAIYPSALFYNRDLFDQAGLPYPPHEWAENTIWTVGRWIGVSRRSRKSPGA